MNCPSCRQALHEDAHFCSNCGASTARFNTKTQIVDPQETIGDAHPHPQDPLIGRVLDSKYELVERLGEGGMGVVYRARRLHIGDEVAVKLLHADLVLEEQAIERFRREARSAAMISHPNVVGIHDFSDARTAGSPAAYIVMELVKGASLRSLLRQEGRLSAEHAVALMSEICAGVGVAHRQGLLHRDLKPDNVIVTPASHEGERETAKVVDFGLAKLRDIAAGATLTQAGAVIGTLSYMSPEQCSGEELDARSDVYSLGAMLFEMLTGGPPFRASNFAGLIAKHLHEPPPPFPESLQIPAALEAACSRALSKNREQRQPDASALSRELQAALKASGPDQIWHPSAAGSLPASPTAGKVPRQRHASSWVKWATAGSAALLVFVGLVGVGIAIKYGGAAHIAKPSAGNSNNAGARNTQNQPNSKTTAAEKGDAAPAETEGSATESTSDLKGTWTGTYGPLNQEAKLIIKNQKGKKFDGVLEQGAIRVAFDGSLEASVVKMKQSAVLNGGESSWALGEDAGTLSSNGKKMAGTGRDPVGGMMGMSYEWSFSRP